MKLLRAFLVLLVAAFAAASVGMGSAQASEYAEYYFPVTYSSVQYNAARITSQPPASPGYATVLTSKSCIRLEWPNLSGNSKISIGWKTYGGWSYPKMFYSYGEIQGYNLIEVEHLLGNIAWGSSHVYELYHDLSDFDPLANKWEFWIDHSKQSQEVYAWYTDGYPITWNSDMYHAGGRTSDASTKLWCYVTLFERLARGGSWGSVTTAGTDISPGGWLNILTYNNYWRYKVYSDNMTP